MAIRAPDGANKWALYTYLVNIVLKVKRENSRWCDSIQNLLVFEVFIDIKLQKHRM